MELDERARVKQMQKEFQIRKMKRLNIFMHTLLCYVCQIVLVGLIFKQLVTQEAEKFRTVESNLFILMARFICSTILHLSLIDEVYAGMDMMKFALN